MHAVVPDAPGEIVSVGQRNIERPPLHDHVDERDRRRIVQARAEFHFALVERFVLLRGRGADAVVIRVERLHDGFARRVAPPRASDDLREQLERPFSRAKVGQPEADVGRDDAHERDRGKVVPLRDHLRADDDVDRPRGHAAQHVGDRAAAADGVAIDAGDARLREPLAEIGLEPFRADASLLQVFAAADAACARHGGRVVAVVAAQPALRAVVRQHDAAVRTFDGRAALAAEHDGREAAAVQQHDGLFALGRAGPRSPRAAAR